MTTETDSDWAPVTHYGIIVRSGILNSALTPKLPAPVLSTEAEYHTGIVWHKCARCQYTYLCSEKHAHGHTTCKE